MHWFQIKGSKHEIFVYYWFVFLINSKGSFDGFKSFILQLYGRKHPYNVIVRLNADIIECFLTQFIVRYGSLGNKLLLSNIKQRNRISYGQERTKYTGHQYTIHINTSITSTNMFSVIFVK